MKCYAGSRKCRPLETRLAVFMCPSTTSGESPSTMITADPTTVGDRPGVSPAGVSPAGESPSMLVSGTSSVVADTSMLGSAGSVESQTVESQIVGPKAARPSWYSSSTLTSQPAPHRSASDQAASDRSASDQAASCGGVFSVKLPDKVSRPSAVRAPEPLASRLPSLHELVSPELPGLTARVVRACLSQQYEHKLSAKVCRRIETVMSKVLAGMPAFAMQVDFRSCAWHSLYLAGLVCSQLPEYHGVLRAYADLIPRPPDLTDSWFLACVLELHPDARRLARELAAGVGVGHVVSAERLFREAFVPTAHVCARLPTRAEAVQLTCGFSQLECLLAMPEAARTLPWNQLAQRETMQGQRLVAFLQSVLDPAECSQVIAVLRDRLSPPQWFSLPDKHFLACVLDHALSAWVSAPEVVVENVQTQAEGPGEVDVLIPAPAPGPVAYMEEVLAECATTEAEERCRWSVVQQEQWARARSQVAEFAAKKLRAGLLKAERANERWRSVGWRWLSLAGMLHDVYGSEQVLVLVKECETMVARPSGVSPLWYLAVLLKRCVSDRLMKRL
ncbi:hypothetical protein GNI_011960, partial [Gregarina niphandrodes]